MKKILKLDYLIILMILLGVERCFIAAPKLNSGTSGIDGGLGVSIIGFVLLLGASLIYIFNGITVFRKNSLDHSDFEEGVDVLTEEEIFTRSIKSINMVRIALLATVLYLSAFWVLNSDRWYEFAIKATLSLIEISLIIYATHQLKNRQVRVKVPLIIWSSIRFIMILVHTSFSIFGGWTIIPYFVLAFFHYKALDTLITNKSLKVYLLDEFASELD